MPLPVKPSIRLLRCLWPLPWSALGLLVGGVMLVGGARAQRVQGVLEFSGGTLGRWAQRGRFAAITLGHVILATDAQQADRLRAHERCHVRQYEQWGPLFVPAYLLAGAWQWACGRCPHADNPFERDTLPP